MKNEIDEHPELYKSYLAALHETAKKKKAKIIKEHVAWLEREEEALKKQFDIKASSIHAEPKIAKKQRKIEDFTPRKKKLKRGKLKPVVFEIMQKMKNEKKDITISGIRELLLSEKGIEATRLAVYTIIRRSPDQVKTKKMGAGRVETIYELEEK